MSLRGIDAACAHRCYGYSVYNAITITRIFSLHVSLPLPPADSQMRLVPVSTLLQSFKQYSQASYFLTVSNPGLCKINPPTIARRNHVLSVCVELPSLSSTRVPRNPVQII